MIRKFGATRSLMVEFEQPVTDFEVPKAKLIRSEGNKKWYLFNRFDTTPVALIRSIGEKHAIRDLQIIEPEVESIVRNLYEKD